MRAISTLAIVTIWVGLGFVAAEETLKVTEFELRDGRKVRTVRYSTAQVGDEIVYTIVALDGEKVNVPASGIAAKTDVRLVARNLSDKMREEMANNRAISGATPAAAEAVDAASTELAAARTRVKEADAEVKLELAELSRAQAALDSARHTMRTAPLEIAAVQARYDAARTQLATAVNYTYWNTGWNGSLAFRNPRLLQDQMIQTGVEKARLEQMQQDAAETVPQLEEQLKAVTEKLQAARQRADEARAGLRTAVTRYRESERERAAVRPPKPPKMEQSQPAPQEEEAPPPMD